MPSATACRQGFEASLKEASGTELGNDFTPLGTTDFSANLIKAQSTNPDAIMLLLAGDDMINCLKQAVQFGLDKKTHIAGAQQELEVAQGPAARGADRRLVFEWYWKQPGVPHVEQFVADIRKRSGGKVPTARTWFGYAAIWTCKLAAEKAKSLEAVKLAKAMQGMVLPPEVALMPNNPYLPRRRQPADADAVRRPVAAGARGRRSGGPVRGHPIGQGRRRGAAGRRDRLQDGVAGVTMRRGGRVIAAPGDFVPAVRGSHVDDSGIC